MKNDVPFHWPLYLHWESFLEVGAPSPGLQALLFATSTTIPWVMIFSIFVAFAWNPLDLWSYTTPGTGHTDWKPQLNVNPLSLTAEKWLWWTLTVYQHRPGYKLQRFQNVKLFSCWSIQHPTRMEMIFVLFMMWIWLILIRFESNTNLWWSLWKNAFPPSDPHRTRGPTEQPGRMKRLRQKKYFPLRLSGIGDAVRCWVDVIWVPWILGLKQPFFLAQALKFYQEVAVKNYLIWSSFGLWRICLS